MYDCIGNLINSPSDQGVMHVETVIVTPVDLPCPRKSGGDQRRVAESQLKKLLFSYVQTALNSKFSPNLHEYNSRAQFKIWDQGNMPQKKKHNLGKEKLQ